ncbi:hypothetical protein TW84_21630 [Vibrio neptunius]|uniref:hypothetical protein n=1 Tax=Vibrio neptunius TaxID=170651 RepID=UPI0005F9C38F|nr:hypothetical protein [Vibrio neptunius]KJY85478.1 hypothetical protein TW84_21630 [Vibrio neptunius]
MSKDKAKENVDIADKSLAQQGALNVEDVENSYRDMNTLLEQASGVEVNGTDTLKTPSQKH